MQKIIFLNGAPGTGKSTLAYGLAKTLPKSVVLDADFIRNQIVGGRVMPGNDGEWEEFDRQRLLAAKSIVAQTKIYYTAGFTIIIASMMPYLSILNHYFPSLESIGPVKKILLLPSVETVHIRDKKREEYKHTPEKVLNKLYGLFDDPYFDDWILLNNSYQTEEESIKMLKKLLEK